MKNRSLTPLRFTVSTLSLLALSGAVLWVSARSVAQNAPPTSPDTKTDAQKTDKQTSDKTNSGKDGSKLESKPERKPAPPNPLVLGNPQDGSGNVLSALDKDGKKTTESGDYRHTQQPSHAGDPSKSLSLFGYDFFTSSRETIDARRAYVIRRYGLAAKGIATRNPSRSRSSGSKQNATGSGQDKLFPDDGTDTNDGIVPGGLRRRSATDGTSSDSGTQRRGATDGSSDSGSEADNGSVQNQSDNSQNFSGSAGSSRNQRNSGSSDQTADLQNNDNDPLTTVVGPEEYMFSNIVGTPPANYQLGPGDELTLRYGSPVEASQELIRRVDTSGSIHLPEIGAVVVRGLTIDAAEKVLNVQFRRFYRNAQVSLTLGKLRTIPVTISGKAYMPGTYMVPATMTAYNMLYAAGGPNEDGSLRNIRVIRNTKTVATLDIYKFLVDGAETGALQLQPGDTIYIPPRQSRVTVSGEVLNQAIYELNKGETLHEALHYAGGVKASGVHQRIQVDTVIPGDKRVEKDVDVTQLASEGKVPLYDGDRVDVFSVRDQLTNQVTIEGAVDQPSDYQLTAGMKVSDLIDRARGPLSEADTTRADLFRWNPDHTTTLIPINLDKALAHDPKEDITLERWDRIKVYTRQEVAWTGNRLVTIKGAVGKPGVYTLSKDMHVSDLLRMAGGPTPQATLDHPSVLLHQNGDGSFSWDKIRLPDIEHGVKSSDPMLQDNDVLAIYRVDEAQFQPDHVVTIKGEVVGAGVYPRVDGMRLSDLLEVSGGFRPNAGSSVTVTHANKVLDGTDNALKTVSVTVDSHGRCAPQDNVPLQDGDVITVQGTGGFVDHVPTIMIKGAVNRPGYIPITSKTMRLSDAIKLANGLRPEAFPQGVEFTRDPKMLGTAGQRSLAAMISSLNDEFNKSDHAREQEKANLERIKAANSAIQDSSPVGLGSSAAAPDAATLAQLSSGSKRDLVPPARVLPTDLLEPNGNVAINLDEAMRHPGGGDDIVLVDGDTITVPEKPTTIMVVGAVFNPRSVLYKPGERIEYYVNLAGGTAPDAAKDRIEIIHAGGGLITAKKVRELQPGDMIVVPTKVMAVKLQQNRNTFDSFFRSITNSAIIFRLATGIFGL